MSIQARDKKSAVLRVHISRCTGGEMLAVTWGKGREKLASDQPAWSKALTFVQSHRVILIVRT